MPNAVFYNNVELFKRGRFDLISYYDLDSKSIVRLHKKQIEAFELLSDNKTKFIGYGGSARSGKSIILCLFALFSSFAYDGVRILIGRHELTNLMKTTWTTMLKLMQNFSFEPDEYHLNGQSNIVTFKEVGSEFFLFDTKIKPSDPLHTRFGSLELTYGLIDESNETGLEIIEMIAARVGTKLNFKYGLKGKVFECFNPDKGHVYDRYWMPFKEIRETNNRRFIRALPSDNPGHEAVRWLEEKIKDYHEGDMRESEYQRLIEGNFDYDNSEDILIDRGMLSLIYDNTHVELDLDDKWLVVDIAFEGSDKFVFSVWLGWVVIICEEMDKSTGKQVLDKITELKNKYQIPNNRIIYDSNGVGAFLGGKSDNSFLPHSISFLANSRALNEENYASLKDQCAYKLADKINSGGIYIKCVHDKVKREYINRELDQIRSKDSDKERKIKIIPKDEIKKNIGRSPDYADVFIMRMLPTIKTSKKIKKSTAIFGGTKW